VFVYIALAHCIREGPTEGGDLGKRGVPGGAGRALPALNRRIDARVTGQHGPRNSHCERCHGTTLLLDRCC
jgi:hypothetical protein